MVRIGRIVLNAAEVSSVLRDASEGTVTVTMKNGAKHEFTKYAAQAWEYFKGRAQRVAG